MTRRVSALLIKGMFCSLAVSIAIAAPFCSAQAPDRQTLETCSTPNSARITTYKFIALGTYLHFNKGASAKAAKEAEALETVFDNSDYCLFRRGVSKEEVEKIDGLMDAFIKPIMGYASKVPDPAAVATAYRNFVAQVDSVKVDNEPHD
jgi:hypothetical protein